MSALVEKRSMVTMDAAGATVAKTDLTVGD